MKDRGLLVFFILCVALDIFGGWFHNNFSAAHGYTKEYNLAHGLPELFQSYVYLLCQSVTNAAYLLLIAVVVHNRCYNHENRIQWALDLSTLGWSLFGFNNVIKCSFFDTTKLYGAEYWGLLVMAGFIIHFVRRKPQIKY